MIQVNLKTVYRSTIVVADILLIETKEKKMRKKNNSTEKR